VTTKVIKLFNLDCAVGVLVEGAGAADASHVEVDGVLGVVVVPPVVSDYASVVHRPTEECCLVLVELYGQ